MADLPSELIFSHKRVRLTTFSNNKSVNTAFKQTQSVVYTPFGAYGSTLTIGIKPNQLSWSYGLNTQSYPTYAGEVVQILSAFINNMTIQGDVRTYNDMELIYQWFIAYMNIATQGQTGVTTLSNIYRYDDDPISMSYPHRGWTLKIRPLSLPTLTYGTDVVVPNWQMEAAVVEDENLQLTQMMNSNLPALVTQQLKNLNGEFGAGLENPFNYWSGNYSQNDINKFLGGKGPIITADSSNNQLTDWFHNLVSQYASGNITEDQLFSKPYTQTIDISSTVTAGAQSSSTTGSLSPSGGLNTTPTLTVPGTVPTINALGEAASPKQAPPAVQSVIAAGNQIINYPYVWGGGHSMFGPTIGIPGGPGYDGHTIGFDCSGSVAYALHGGGLEATPGEVSSNFESYGSPGYGQWITIFASGDHVFMAIGPNIQQGAGIIFDTVDLGTAVPPGSGPRWFSASQLPSLSGFIIRHPTGY